MRVFRHHLTGCSVARAALDLGVLGAAGAATLLQLEPGLGGEASALGALAAFATVLFAGALGLYRQERSGNFGGFARTLALAVALSALALFVTLPHLSGALGHERAAGLVASLQGVAALAALATHAGFALVRRAGWLNHTVLVVASPLLAARLRLFVEPAVAGGPRRIVHAAPGGQALAELARRHGADELVVADDLPVQALWEAKIAGLPVTDYMSFVEREARLLDMGAADARWLLAADGFHAGAFDALAKRAFDIAVSLTLLLWLSPLILGAALAVRLESPGPALFRQARVTSGGRVFTILKLRSMRRDAERAGPQWSRRGDARVTRIGAVLRRTRLDELPQLVNVLKGDMAFVGPRPERPVFVEELSRQIPFYAERHRVKAGLTGWAQVNYPYGASAEDAAAKLAYDLYYVKNCSLLLDVMIALETLRVVFWPLPQRVLAGAEIGRLARA